MKFKELKSLTKEDLEKKYLEVEIELIKVNAQVATGTTLKNPGQVKQLKKILAKIKTLQKQNE
ncbi:MAG: 50S ribosomal protein L29 [Nanoarchaeota archaeon]|nr:50S ribosomal protein L29 [Nanoarchaeota archaeon]MBU1030513.1 50S ribosomal protein L29 [Nanoarchaeota archaeon]MBU1850475.1 50S ribosomal protein L29 [Nanoarchaeota archaeon]